MDFVTELVRKRGKENLQKFLQFIVHIFQRSYFAFSDYVYVLICHLFRCFFG